MENDVCIKADKVEETVSYTVYMHVNRINGKVYIGRTKMNVNKRWDNGRGYIRNPGFNADIQQYGWHNFDHKILYTDLTLEQADEIERQLIKEYNSADPDNGYNIALGGSGADSISEATRVRQSKAHKGQTPWNKGIPNSPETRQKIREALTGGHLSEETKRKMSQSRMGEGNSFYGKHHSKETIHAMALKQPNRTMVICVDTGEIFESMAEAARQKGVAQGAISCVCHGRNERCGGLRWAFYQE